MKYEFNEEEIKALSVFLGRVDLKGQEVPAFNRIVSVLGNPIKEEVKVEEPIEVKEE